ncbi:beta-ketoacyl-[acyl-carrier-protein] synthase family protein [Mycetocola spongiae]|uniref:beta-ketoacyl-[acyl-carrier-protein] synthase family protein n=1 Tax=Mycetocola spongiae TaxID=2859226 RepID=UPI001CF12565|nr:beta-ketoacyl-[acyl-carrier-protein] synthase family protein [Mycetocola spongiae]UCR88465.1 beta-ketoacyl-[acyl-carrier-protein] synthase family protein [Mycetocola spongiae]
MRIVVTGLGLRSAAGMNLAESRETIFAGVSNIGPTDIVPTDQLISGMSGQVRGMVEEGEPSSSRGYLDRCNRLALAGAVEALEGSGLDRASLDPTRIGLSVGTALGGARSGESFHRQWIEGGLRRANGGLLRQYPLHAVADFLAAELELSGPRSVQSNACAAGTVAIGYGVELLLSGQADVMVAGGVDPLAYFSFGGFSCLGALDPEHCAPYSRSSGLNLGEGSGFLILEREEDALARGAKIHAVVAGYGLSADAHHATAPDITGRGAVRAMTSAANMAGITLDDIDYINGHGTGTPANDAAETRVARQFVEGALGNARMLPISSTKSMVGHTLGAAGAIEAVITVLALENGELPPTRIADPADVPADLDIVTEGRPADIRNAFSNSFAFGGNNASLLLQRYRPLEEPSAPIEDIPVVITGIGAIAGSAATTEDVREALSSATPAYGEMTVDVEEYGHLPVAEIPEGNLKRGINPAQLRRMDTLGRRAAVATAQLIRERGLTREQLAETGLIFATGIGPLSTVEAFERDLILNGTGNTRLFPNTVMNAAGGHVALLNKIQGPTATICCGNTGGITALHFAESLIRRGRAERIIVLSADEAPRAMLAGYARIPGYLARSVSAPFTGQGRLIGGAAVAILLEREDLVEPDAVRGRISGYGLTGDTSGHGRIAQDPTGWSRSFELGMAEAGITPEAVDVVIASACGLPKIDDVESAALTRAGLGDRPLLAPKGIVGDAGASAGLLGVAQAIWMAEEGRIHGNAGERGTAPEGFLGAEGRAGSVHNTLVSSYEVGGSFQSVLVSTP